MRVSILIPIYNERPTLAAMLRAVAAAPLPPGCEKEIILVDDGSSDGGADLLREFAAATGARLTRRAVNRGKGAALRAGLERATGDIVLIQDGDQEYDPADYPRLLAPILAGEAEVVYGSRFRGAGDRWPAGMARRNLWGNRVLTAAANLLFAAHISDEATAYKAFRMATLRRLRLRCRRFEFCPEVTAKLRRLGVSIVETPISYRPRGLAEGKKIRARDGWAALRTLLLWRCAPRRWILAAPLTPAGWPWRRPAAEDKRRAGSAAWAE